MISPVRHVPRDIQIYSILDRILFYIIIIIYNCLIVVGGYTNYYLLNNNIVIYRFFFLLVFFFSFVCFLAFNNPFKTIRTCGPRTCGGAEEIKKYNFIKQNRPRHDVFRTRYPRSCMCVGVVVVVWV